MEEKAYADLKQKPVVRLVELEYNIEIHVYVECIYLHWQNMKIV